MKKTKNKVKKLCCYCSGNYINGKCKDCNDKANFKFKEEILNKK